MKRYQKSLDCLTYISINNLLHSVILKKLVPLKQFSKSETLQLRSISWNMLRMSGVFLLVMLFDIDLTVASVKEDIKSRVAESLTEEKA